MLRLVSLSHDTRVIQSFQLEHPTVGDGQTFPSFGDCAFARKPWMILGKGPSFSKFTKIDATRYNVLAINHVVDRLDACDIAHFADWETFEACGHTAEARAKFVCMPYVPFLKFAPSPNTILQHARESERLRRMIGARRVLVYNLMCTSQGRRIEGHPDVHLTNFSAEAVIDYLGKCEVGEVVSLGVDGGATYSNAFSNLVGKTLLASGQSTYDLQFSGMSDAMMRTGVHYSPADMRRPICVKINCRVEHDLAARVLAYSMQRHVPVKLDFDFALHSGSKLRSTHEGIRIFRDRAGPVIEIDARSLVLRSLMPLMRKVFGDESPKRRLEYAPQNRASARPSIAPWLRSMIKPSVAFFYRRTDCPWESASAPHHAVWMTALREAVYWKFVSISQVRRAIAQGHVSPSIFESMHPKRMRVNT